MIQLCGLSEDVAEAAKKEFARKGFCHVPGVVPNSYCAEMIREAKEHQDRGNCFLSDQTHNIFQLDEEDCVFEIQKRQVTSRKTIIDYGYLSKSSKLKGIYEDPALRKFIAQVINRKIYPSACPYNAGYYNLYYDGDGLGWHFDKASFGVLILLQ